MKKEFQDGPLRMSSAWQSPEGWEFPPGSFSNILPAVSSLSVVLLFVSLSSSFFHFLSRSLGWKAEEGGPGFR